MLSELLDLLLLELFPFLDLRLFSDFFLLDRFSLLDGGGSEVGDKVGRVGGPTGGATGATTGEERGAGVSGGVGDPQLLGGLEDSSHIPESMNSIYCVTSV